MARREKQKAEARKKAREEGGAVAEYKGIRMSARKARVIADVIRGLPVDEAHTALAFQRRAAAVPMQKALESAIANADQRKMDVDRLIVGEVQVNKGAIMRRYMPRAHGRATRVRKQTSHIRIQLVEA